MRGHGFLRGLTSASASRPCSCRSTARRAGAGKYNRLTGSLKIGFNGIVAFSDSLLRLMVVAGLSMAGVAMLAIPSSPCSKPTASTASSRAWRRCILMLFLGGIQLIGMGLLGSVRGPHVRGGEAAAKFIVEIRSASAARE